MTTLNTAKLFIVARQHQQADRLDEAEEIYRRILAVDSKNADVHHMLGLVARRRGDNHSAVDLIRCAIKLKPNYPDAIYNLANALNDLGKSEEAIGAYRKAICFRPGFTKAYNNLGTLLAKIGRLDEAVAIQNKLIEIDPNFPNIYYSLGNSLREQGKFEQAIAAFQKATIAKPDFGEAFHNLGCCLGQSGHPELAVDAFKKSLSINTNNRDGYDNLSVTLRVLGRLDEAIAVSRKSVEYFPDAASCVCNLGHALSDRRDLDEAFSVYNRAISLDPNLIAAYQGLAQVLEKQGKVQQAIETLKTGRKRGVLPEVFDFELAALGAGTTPQSPPPAYLVELFNDYAENFDNHLVKILKYSGPELLFEAVSALNPPQPMDILDLGCGTGLCGQLFKPMAGYLSGVDIAPKMIAQSRKRGVYDRLEVQDVTIALKQEQRRFDLILSGDVFIYVGALEPVFEAAATALRPGGLLAFTVESIEEGEYILRQSRRYAHSAAYISKLASIYGFKQVSSKDATIRTEKEVPMPGKAIVLALV